MDGCTQGMSHAFSVADDQPEVGDVLRSMVRQDQLSNNTIIAYLDRETMIRMLGESLNQEIIPDR
jgi:hypothetical protein